MAKTPIVMGSALAALESRDDKIGSEKIIELTNACDEWLTLPPRDLEKPFLMAIEGLLQYSHRCVILTVPQMSSPSLVVVLLLLVV